jgi:outer membrane lipase/esterase
MSLCRALHVAAAVCVSNAAAAGYSGLYVFGDSLADPGNLAAAIGADPAQVISGNGYIPDRPYASLQFSNGDVWARTYATAIGLGSFGLPFGVGGGNFAFGGARVTADGPGLPPSLTTQETVFFLGARGGVAPPDALYVIEGGGNDARDTLAAAAIASDPFAVIGPAALAYAAGVGNLVDQLQASGAEHIVVWNVPDLGLAPAVTTLGAGASFLGSIVSQTMNSALSTRLAGEDGVTLFDVFGAIDSFASTPVAFDLLNVTDACGAIVGCDPSTSLFWDGIHPTSAGHALLAQEMFAATVPEPADYVLLLAGLVAISRRIRRRGTRAEIPSAHP